MKHLLIALLAFTIAASAAEDVLGTGTLEARVKTQVSARIQERLVEVLVDQGDTVKKGQKARVVFRSEPQKNYPGVVSRLGREMDRETREFLVDVRVEQLPVNWAVGQRAEVYIQIDTAKP